MAYSKTYSLKSHDYSLDHREDELVWEFKSAVTFTMVANTADLEVPTSLSEVVGVIGMGFCSTFAAGDNLNNLSTDGVVTSGAVTVRIVTTSIPDGAFTTALFVLGRKKAIDQ